jgi:chromosome segregation ATPase
MLERLSESKAALEETKKQVEAESNTYKEMIADAESEIKAYKSMIKNLEELCEGYKMIIDNNIVKVSKANRDVAHVLNTMIGKKEF